MQREVFFILVHMSKQLVYRVKVLWAVGSSYTRSLRFMRGEIFLYALGTIYARWDQVIRAQSGLCAVGSSYTRSLRFMRAPAIYLYVRQNSPKSFN